MNKKIMLISLVAALALFAAACAAPAPTTNTTTTTNTTRTTTNTNTAAPAANTSTTTNTSTSNANSSSSQQGGAQDFTLVNQTGVEIHSVYISPHDSNDWEEDILGRDTLPSGESVDIKFSRNEKAAMWDLRVEDKQGNSIEWENLNLLEISKVTLHYQNGKATAETQ